MVGKVKWKIGFLALALSVAATAKIEPGVWDVTNLDEIQRGVGLTAAHKNIPLFDVGVAVIDPGFKGLYITGEDGKPQIAPGVLPEGAKIVEDYSDALEGCEKAKKLAVDVSHGAQGMLAAWAGTGNNPTMRKLLGLNSNGFEAFRCAVRYAVLVAKVDIIIHSNNFEYGGNFDGGSSAVGDLVKWATSHGVLWFNSAGNSHDLVYNGPVKDETVLRLRSNYAGNPVNIKVAYTAPLDTDRDLDFEIVPTDKNKQQVPVSNYAQGAKVVPPPPEPGLPELQKTIAKTSKPVDDRPPGSMAVEAADVTLERNDPKNEQDLYLIRVFKRGGTFNEGDQIRVTITPKRPLSGEPVTFLDKTGKQELAIPADDPTAITVNDLYPNSSVGPTRDGRDKPEVAARVSTITFANGDYQAGSSVGNWFVGGSAAVLVGMAKQASKPGREYRLTRTDILRFANSAETFSMPTRQPAMGNLPSDAKAVTMEEVRSNHRYGDTIVNAIERAAPTVSFNPYRLGDGSFLLASPQVEPARIKALFSKFDLENNQFRLNQYSYYISVQTDALSPFTTWRWDGNGQGGVRQNRPWEDYPTFTKNDFIELRFVPMAETRVTSRTVKNLWKLGSEADLKGVLAL
ncbi:hypothetical protein K2X33_03950 [bacterium]|nr:hypothetical protein [bacterium]